tara:strand:- start:967 stop:1944 length:978 start_codon:yes stop_codon:yes gene_type:complete
MASTLETCANTAARPATPALGATLYQEDTNQIIVCSNATGPVWKTYEANGELAYPSGIYTEGTPYVISVQPAMHFDASRINGADASGNPAINGKVATWEDRSGNSNDATQGTAADQGAFVKMGGHFGIKMPTSTTLGMYETGHTFASGSDGFTVVGVFGCPNACTSKPVNCARSGATVPVNFQDPGIKVAAVSCTFSLSHLGGNYYTSTLGGDVSSAGPRIVSVLDGDGDQKLFEAQQVGYTGTAARTQAAIDDRLGGPWWLGWDPFGAAASGGGGGIYNEILIFRNTVGYTVDGSGNLNGGDLNTIVSYLANKYGVETNPVMLR